MQSPSQTPAPNLEPGDLLGRYELIARVAEGGMGTVWLARLVGVHGFERRVAVKTIRSLYAKEQRFRSMFLDEARLAARIENPHVVQVLDLGERGGILFYVMEWVDGESLSDLIAVLSEKGRVVPPAIAARIIRDASAGLHAAHGLRDASGQSLEVVHRDVSPSNVLVTTAGVGKVVDFGIAKARQRVAPETSLGRVKGKPHYMAPEQVAGRPLDRRADIWGLGAVLYETLTGRTPFDDTNPMRLLQEIASGAPSLSFSSDVPESLQAVVRRAMARKPSARFESAEDMGTAIERAMASCDLVASAADVRDFLKEAVGDRLRQREQVLDQAAACIHASAANTVAYEIANEEEATTRPQQRSPGGQDDTPSGPFVVPGTKSKNLRVAAFAMLGAVAGIVVMGLFWLRTHGETPSASTRASTESSVPIPANVDAAPVSEPTTSVASVAFRIETTPDGAGVWKDGGLLGRTPLDSTLPPGVYELKVELDGHVAQRLRLELAKDAPKRTHELDLVARRTPPRRPPPEPARTAASPPPAKTAPAATHKVPTDVRVIDDHAPPLHIDIVD